MKEKIELQIADVEQQMVDSYKLYLDTLQSLNNQQTTLNQALIYATNVPSDVQAILDAAQ